METLRNVGRLYFLTVGLYDIYLNPKFVIELYAIIFCDCSFNYILFL